MLSNHKKPFNKKRAWERILGIIQKGTRVRVARKQHKQFTPVWCYDGWVGTILNKEQDAHGRPYWNILFRKKDNCHQLDEEEVLTFREGDFIVI